MKTSIQILPGVKSIGWIDCRHLPRRVDLSAICRMPVAILTTITPIDFFDDPQCDCKTTKDGGGYSDTANLKFLTHSPLPGSNVAFVVTDVNDRSFLIGSLENPAAVPEPTRRLGTPTGDAAGYYYEIKHVALKSLVPCIV